MSFNEPASPASVAAGAPSYNNLNGVAAASRSATTVPVLGTLAAPLPAAGYAAGYAPTAVGGVSVSRAESRVEQQSGCGAAGAEGQRRETAAAAALRSGSALAELFGRHTPSLTTIGPITP